MKEELKPIVQCSCSSCCSNMFLSEMSHKRYNLLPGNGSSDQIGDNNQTQIQPAVHLQPLDNKRVNGSSDQIGNNHQTQIQPVVHLQTLDNKRINGSSDQIGKNRQTQVQPVTHMQPLGNKREAIKDEGSNQGDGDGGLDISLPGLPNDHSIKFYRTLIEQQQLEMNRFISQQMEKLKYELVQKQSLQTSRLVEKFKVVMRKYKEKEDEVERTKELNTALEARCRSLEDHMLRYLAEDAFSDTGSNDIDDEEEEQERVCPQHEQ